MNKPLGDRLARLLNDTGFAGPVGLRRFAELLKAKHGISASQSTIYYWMSGGRSPELPTLRAILDLLGICGDERNEIVKLALPDGLLSDNRPSDADDVPTVTE